MGSNLRGHPTFNPPGQGIPPHKIEVPCPHCGKMIGLVIAPQLGIGIGVQKPESDEVDKSIRVKGIKPGDWRPPAPVV